MPNLSDLIGSGGKPKLITAYTSGTGTYIPLENNSRCFVRLVGGGGGGASQTAGYGGGGGGGGLYMEITTRIPIAGVPYSVGSAGLGVVGGAVGGAGSQTMLGNIVCEGGGGGYPGANSGATAGNGGSGGGGVASIAPKISGGAGGRTTFSGFAPGNPVTGVLPGNGKSTTPLNGGGGGGDSVMGVGGNGAKTTNGFNATGYGGGGGGTFDGYTGGNGSGGYIEIWDYGA